MSLFDPKLDEIYVGNTIKKISFVKHMFPFDLALRVRGKPARTGCPVWDSTATSIVSSLATPLTDPNLVAGPVGGPCDLAFGHEGWIQRD